MKVPQMPTQLQGLLRSAFRTGDVDSIVHFNKIWNAHVKEVREEQRKEVELEASQNEGRYQNEN
jgi:hypothetical protein